METTALVLIDLQHSNVARTLAPHSAQQVVENGARLADAVRGKGGTVVYVRVLVNELLPQPGDVSVNRDPSAAPLPPQAWEIVDAAGMQPGDIVIDKRQWGAFHGTSLEQQLRRRGIKTIILGGIATNFGVESTARAAQDLGYALMFAEDAMSSIKAEMHQFSVQTIFPILGHVRSTAELLATIG
ncbi:isochorismatase family protein [Duganella sp. FT109W]|uniref:Isochorismatase family protein n=1 Tax=Duganella margarita TaxID=2692170 RepID=A0ABW9WN63_9BURK|nr:isochorismatase family protein [Duganella margarita]MYN42321.1 isochorismatase family protein [Duganella margarita]